MTLERRRTVLWPVAAAALEGLYGGRPDFAAFLERIDARVRRAYAERDPELRALDAGREAQPAWFQAPDRIAYTFYVDRFAGRLEDVAVRIPYLRELGITYLHPLPLSRPRAGDNDGGFAVADFLDVDPRLGDFDDLRTLCTALRRAGVSLVLDVVCNHTADDHAWAQAARAGDARFQSFYHLVATAEEVRAWEAGLADVFPQTAPGSFTFDPQLRCWVWTTFYPYQWDLNYAEPAVFEAMLDVLLELANAGAEGFRLDSAPFLWKRMGTACRGLPEVHLIIQAWRALLSIAAPGVLLKAEAIEKLDDVLPFLGAPEGSAECQLAYQNGVMAALWAALATGDAGPARQVIAAAAARPRSAAWLNYVRCHDDLIWSALSPYDLDRELMALSRFYAGEAAGPFRPRGEAFQATPGSAPSTNGMTADLVGLGFDGGPQDAGLRRLLLLYGVTYALDGTPLIYMGDEIALGGDPGYRDDPARCGDGRWLHRPLMDWRRARNRHDLGTVEGAVFSALARYGRVRGAEPSFHAREPAQALDVEPACVLAFARGEGPGRIVCLGNFSAEGLSLALAELPDWIDLLSGDAGQDAVPLAPWGVRWLKAAA